MMGVGKQVRDRIEADARLQILLELASQMNGSLTIKPIQVSLDVYGLARDRDWILTQLRKLEALGAIELRFSGETPIATISRSGRDHLDERAVIEGVTRPAEVE